MDDFSYSKKLDSMLESCRIPTQQEAIDLAREIWRDRWALLHQASHMEHQVKILRALYPFAKWDYDV
jgi:hypothetical protein